MEFTKRQREIIEIVKNEQPISGNKIAQHLNLTRPTLRNDLSILTMTGMLDAKPKVGYFYSGQHANPLTFETLYEVPVATVMLTPVLIKPTTTLQDAVTTLFMYDIGSLYVADDEQQLLGVISRKDLLRATLNTQDLTQIFASMIMTRMPNITTITAEDRILDAGYLLMSHQVDSLPVLAERSKKVVGKVTKTKIMQYFVEVGMKIEHEKYD
ncbi:helix-turn-helix transcriptional regulator [Loigolactobacillus backii]|uniref:Transcriptional repressor CcpN n=1 Tax=Loigolactobacillus backii TaxID=375175 RepID=A0A192H302_9LACO|nr:helix-turn-helix transcriptional regulator [Loigolactobacillus backii]ANK60227.1 transcriptional repressor CcpN [Loigolactobacillus backii]ANK62331.1 transcriptional repressor CcpN [Loigolactobacillus backii]ANK65109.1 transcriptional repressor CcpN [Loigolactobacillus backii]ANK67668.1 transcriptional repressor CcpN [Loigolactobacillus backii]ANK70656.1 transcriptional repressor CcpN [Loigolactobacillus backii]